MTNWQQRNTTFFQALEVERNVMFLILTLILLVAALNIISGLFMLVKDKGGDIAILRTMGASGRDIAWIFVLQGAMIGVVGAVLGSGFGTLLSHLVPSLVGRLESALDVQFLNTDVYPVSFLPVEVVGTDILLVSGVAFLMCVLAALYPARRAAGLAPALILGQDH